MHWYQSSQSLSLSLSEREIKVGAMVKAAGSFKCPAVRPTLPVHILGDTKTDMIDMQQVSHNA